VSTGEFNALIHAPNRLQLCALLASVDEMEFRTLTEQLGISDSLLSKQVKLLEDEGFVTHRKRTANGRPRTWLSLTRDGRRAFLAHIKALQAIISDAK